MECAYLFILFGKTEREWLLFSGSFKLQAYINKYVKTFTTSFESYKIENILKKKAVFNI